MEERIAIANRENWQRARALDDAAQVARLKSADEQQMAATDVFAARDAANLDGTTTNVHAANDGIENLAEWIRSDDAYHEGTLVRWKRPARPRRELAEVDEEACFQRVLASALHRRKSQTAEEHAHQCQKDCRADPVATVRTKEVDVHGAVTRCG